MNIPLNNIKRTCGESNTICRNIIQGKYYAVLAPRFFGKTAFLKQIQEKLNIEKHVIFYADLKDYRYLSRECFLSKFQEALQNNLKVRLDNAESMQNLLEDLKNKLQQLIIFFLDDIDTLDESNTRELLLTFRRFSNDTTKWLSAVFGGSKDLLELSTGKNSPIKAESFFLKELSEKEAEDFLKSYKRYNKRLFKDIYKDAGGHPYFLYILSNARNKEELNHNKNKIINHGEDDSYLKYILDNIRNNPDLLSLLCSALDGKLVPFENKRAFLSGIFKLDDKCCFANNIVEAFLKRYFDKLKIADFAVYNGDWELAKIYYSKSGINIQRPQEVINLFGHILLSGADFEKIKDLIEEGARYILGFKNPELYICEDGIVLKSRRQSFKIKEDKDNNYVKSFSGNNDIDIDRHFILKSSDGKKIGLLVLE